MTKTTEQQLAKMDRFVEEARAGERRALDELQKMRVKWFDVCEQLAAAQALSLKYLEVIIRADKPDAHIEKCWRNTTPTDALAAHDREKDERIAEMEKGLREIVSISTKPDSSYATFRLGTVASAARALLVGKGGE